MTVSKQVHTSDNNDEEENVEQDSDQQLRDYFTSNLSAHSSTVASIHKPEQVELVVTVSTQVHTPDNNDEEENVEQDSDQQVRDYFTSNLPAHSSIVASIHKPEQVELGVTVSTQVHTLEKVVLGLPARKQVHISGQNSKQIDGKKLKVIFQHYV